LKHRHIIIRVPVKKACNEGLVNSLEGTAFINILFFIGIDFVELHFVPVDELALLGCYFLVKKKEGRGKAKQKNDSH